MKVRVPRLAITVGDPSGVGPEIIVKALSQQLHTADNGDEFIAIVVGDWRIIERARERFAPALQLSKIDTARMAESSQVVYVYDVPSEGIDPANPVRSQGTVAVGTAAYDALRVATTLALAGDADAVVTAPLNKEALSRAGHVGVGHTELLADLCAVARGEVTMMLASDRLKIAHVSTHVALRTAIETLSTDRIVTVGRLAGTAVARGLDREPVIAVAGLNPHAGEGGLFGRQELDIIAPAVRILVDEGRNAVGPIPPDNVFVRAVNGEVDVVIAMYHDQGHIPAKLIGFHDTVNVSLGLPIIRVSVDHGTAYDIAWQGKADARNMSVALTEAVRMCV